MWQALWTQSLKRYNPCPLVRTGLMLQSEKQSKIETGVEMEKETETEMEMGTENTSVSVVCASVSVTPQAGSASDFPFSIGLDITSVFQTLVAVPLSSTRMVPFFLGLLNWNFIQTLNFIFHITVTQGHCIFIYFSSRPSFLNLALVLKTSSGLQCLPQERMV